MSILSAQVDELRERAKTLRQGRWSDGADDARLMEDAADTIWELRNDLQWAHRDNAELREEIEAAKHDLQVFSMGSVQLEAENAKLRELVADMWEACPADGYYCIYHCKHYDKESESHCKLEDRMRELGIEVNA